jgi:hypothetical protein
MAWTQFGEKKMSESASGHFPGSRRNSLRAACGILFIVFFGAMFADGCSPCYEPLFVNVLHSIAFEPGETNLRFGVQSNGGARIHISVRNERLNDLKFMLDSNSELFDDNSEDQIGTWFSREVDWESPDDSQPPPIIIVEVERPPSDELRTVELELRNRTDFDNCEWDIATRIVELRVIEDPDELESDF